MVAPKSRQPDNPGRQTVTSFAEQQGSSQSIGTSRQKSKPRLPKSSVSLQFRGALMDKYNLRGSSPDMKALFDVFEKAIAQARTNRPVGSLRVDFGPEGALISEVEEAVIVADTPPAIDPKLELALQAARERGRHRAAEVLAGHDMVSADELAKLIGTTRVTVNNKRLAGHLLGLDGVKRGFRFPIWQLNADGKPYPALGELHERLGNAWAVYRFLVHPNNELDGMTGREALERGKSAEALEAAESMGRDFA